MFMISLFPEFLQNIENILHIPNQYPLKSHQVGLRQNPANSSQIMTQNFTIKGIRINYEYP